MAQPALTALDTWLSNEWRRESRSFRTERKQWRKEDLDYRLSETALAECEKEYRNRKRRWRTEDVTQRRVDNSRHLWHRVKETNRREVEEKTSQLISFAWLSALIAGFTMTAPVEFSYTNRNPPIWLVSLYAGTTAIVPLLMTTAAMMSIYLLQGVVKMGKSFVREDKEEEFMASCVLFSEEQSMASAPPAPRRCFTLFWNLRLESSWRQMFMVFSFGVGSFFLLIGAMSFLKFSPIIWIPSIAASLLFISSMLWLRMRTWWGAYLTAPPKDLSLSVKRPCAGDPFDWHIQPVVYGRLEPASAWGRRTESDDGSESSTGANDSITHESMSPSGVNNTLEAFSAGV